MYGIRKDLMISKHHYVMMLINYSWCGSAENQVFWYAKTVENLESMVCNSFLIQSLDIRIRFFSLIIYSEGVVH